MNILVLGDGLLGSEIVKQTGWDCKSRYKKNFNIDDLSGLIDYDIIVNCIANTDTYSTKREKHWKVNYEFVNDLIKYCNEYGKKLIHISTDYIYAGAMLNASEEHVPVHCGNWYGYTKLLGDGLVQLQCEDYLICRCTHKEKPFPYDAAWIDQIGNFDYVDKISELIIELINNNASGVYNVGTETKTMFDLAKQTKDVSVSYAPVFVPKNQSMNLDKLNSTL